MDVIRLLGFGSHGVLGRNLCGSLFSLWTRVIDSLASEALLERDILFIL